jgi:hypothetical protein
MGPLEPLSGSRSGYRAQHDRDWRTPLRVVYGLLPTLERPGQTAL